MIFIVQETVWPSGHKIRLLLHNWKNLCCEFLHDPSNINKRGGDYPPSPGAGRCAELFSHRAGAAIHCHACPCSQVHVNVHRHIWEGTRIPSGLHLFQKEVKCSFNAVKENIISVLWSLQNVLNGLASKRTEKPMEKLWFRQCSVKYVCMHFPLG